ncbi:MAG TPA: hypothetical protein VK171_06995 [Fimbriimonas sp.]|nr:hypothetical protein [Fimbriimonas sp.]
MKLSTDNLGKAFQHHVDNKGNTHTQTSVEPGSMKYFWLVASLAPCIALADEPGQWSIKFEGSSFQTIRNDARVPGNTGTEFSLKLLLGSAPKVAQYRYEILYQQDADTTWRVLFAPLSIAGAGVLPNAVNFNGTTFNPGATNGLYEFNSYRLSYLKRWWKSDRSDWKFGYTVKVRNARIQLTQGALNETESDPTGIVPLLTVRGEERLGDKWLMSFELDGLAAPQGRAFDLGLSIGYDVSDRARAYAGVRLLEGGASNDKVFTFAQFHYLTFGTSWRF